MFSLMDHVGVGVSGTVVEVSAIAVLIFLRSSEISLYLPGIGVLFVSICLRRVRILASPPRISSFD